MYLGLNLDACFIIRLLPLVLGFFSVSQLHMQMFPDRVLPKRTDSVSHAVVCIGHWPGTRSLSVWHTRSFSFFFRPEGRNCVKTRAMSVEFAVLVVQVVHAIFLVGSEMCCFVLFCCITSPGLDIRFGEAGGH